MSKLLFQNVSYLAGDSLSLSRGDVLVENGKIIAMGQLPAEQKAGAAVAATGAHHLLMPGFVNTHTHVAMTLLRDYGGDQPLDKWLNEYIWPVEAKLTDEDVYWCSALGLLEMFATGTTCMVDMYDHCDAIAQAMTDGGMRAILSRGSVGMFDAEGRGIRENDEVYDRWHGANNDKIRVWYAPHAPNTCPGEYIQEMAAHARARKTGVHIHVSETKGELAFTQEKYGMTPLKWLDSLGVLDVPTLAAHGVWLTEEEMEICAKHHVAVAHNPVSNLKLASGIAPVTVMTQKGMIVGLGTDGASSNNTLNMHRELQTLALIHKVRAYDAEEMGANESLRMATIDGARAVCWDDQIGSLAIGKQADITVFKLDNPWNAPFYDLVSNIVYGAQTRDIVSVYVQGNCVYKQGEYLTLDKEKIMSEATIRAKALLTR